MKRAAVFFLAICMLSTPCLADEQVTRFRPARVFDGEAMHSGWTVVVQGHEILYAGPDGGAPAVDADYTVEVPDSTLMPGMIEGHSHILLHPYNETAWNDQVLKESVAERVARAVNHVRASLMAGMTTMRDLGTEGAGYADIGVRDSIAKGIIPGPRLLVAGRAIVATGSYGPKGFHEGVSVPLGAQVADGYDELVRVVREQIGMGIDVVKVYADYRWGPNGTAAPTFTEQELATVVAVAASSGRAVAAHAATDEGMRRAVNAGITTIEHGDAGTDDTFRLMAKKHVALCPTLAAGDAISQYGGWRKGVDPEPVRIREKRESFARALKAGVTMCFGGDVGVYPHGDNVREFEMMVDYGMDALGALRSATSINASVFKIGERVGKVKQGMQADLVLVVGDPLQDISDLRNVALVMQNGNVVRDDTTAPVEAQ